MVSLSLTVPYCHLCSVCWCAVLLENNAIVTRNVLNVRQQHLLQDDVSVIFSIDLDARLQEVDISASKTRHPDKRP